MQIVRLYDPARDPQGWMQIIRPDQFAAFPTLAGSGAVCDPDGVPIKADAAACIIFDTLTAAESFCRARVEQIPELRFDILDSAGHLRPPLLTIVHSSRAAALEGSPGKIRWNTYVAIALLLIGPPLVWFDWKYYEGVMVVPTIFGINAVLIAARLLIMNYTHASKERARRERVAQAHRLPGAQLDDQALQ